MSDIIGFNSSINFVGGVGVLSLEDDFALNGGQPPFVYKENYQRYAREKNLPPQDLSLFAKPAVEPIKIPKSTTTSYNNTNTNPTVNYGNANNAVNVDAFEDYSPNNKEQNITNRTDLGAKQKTVSRDLPEQNFDPFLAESDDEYYSRSFTARTGDGSGNNAIKINGSSDAKANSKKANFPENLTKISIDPRTNELNQFSSVSYNIALYMMNSKSYVDLTSQPNDPNFVLDPNSGVSQLLMRSGGTGIDNPNNDFSNNFFIDDLEIQAIAVGPDKFRHNTNATNIRFTITEPRGVTLLEKLQRLAGTVLASTKEKYIHAPYLLEIKFKGYDENGKPMPASSTPKYIPIKITDIKFEVNSSGTQYRVEAIPFANHTMGSVMSTIPHNIELKASTVGDIFDSEVIQTRTVRERVEADPRFRSATGSTPSIFQNKTIKTTHKNLGEILTDSRRRRTQPTKLTDKDLKVTNIPPAAVKHDTYSFLIADEIARAELNIDDIYDALNTPTPTDDSKKGNTSADQKQYEAYVQSLTKGITLDKKTKTFTIAAGTDITKLINLVIMHSDYMDKNIEENPQAGLKTGDPINWFKIRPVIASSTQPGGGYDSKDGRYKYLIQYVVEKNVVHYSDFPWAKKSKPVGIGYHKKYDFIFTGQNTEVLDFDLKFNVAFIQTMTAGTGHPSNFDSKPVNLPFTPTTKELPSSVEGNIINSEDGLKRQRAKDLFSSVMSDGVDLVNLDLRIVGDPAWIPTSDAYWQDKVRQGESYTQAFMPDGTINYNLTSPFIQLNLKTPTDYDETTGLQDPNKAGNSSFSGVYRIFSCDSTFSGGVFQQRLTGMRPPGQDADLAQLKVYNRSGSNSSSNSQRKDLFDTVKDTIIQKANTSSQVKVLDQFPEE